MLKVWESNGGYEGMFVLMEIDDCFAAMHIHYFQHNDQNLRAKNNMVYRITGLYPFDVKTTR